MIYDGNIADSASKFDLWWRKEGRGARGPREARAAPPPKVAPNEWPGCAAWKSRRISSGFLGRRWQPACSGEMSSGGGRAKVFWKMANIFDFWSWNQMGMGMGMGKWEWSWRMGERVYL